MYRGLHRHSASGGASGSRCSCWTRSIISRIPLPATCAGGTMRSASLPRRIGSRSPRHIRTTTTPNCRRLVGAVVYRRTIGEMTDHELASFALERRYVPLTSAEAERYAR